MSAADIRRRLTLAAITCATVATAASAEVRYTYTDLGTFGGANSRAYDVNDRGQVVGWASTSTPATFRTYDWITGAWQTVQGTSEPPNAFLYDHGTMVNIGRADESSRAMAINNSARVVGAVGNASNTERAFRLRYGPLDETHELGFLDGAIKTSFAWDNNDRGQTVGNTYDGAGYAAFVYENDQMRSLGPLLGGPSHTRAINNNGVVVGDSFLSSNYTGAIHAYRHDTTTGVTTDLGTLATTTHGNNYGQLYPMLSHAFDINDRDQIVGLSYVDVPPGTYGARHHAFLWEDGVMKDLGTLPTSEYSEAYAINAHGTVVGRSGWRAFVYQDGQMLDLNDLVAPLGGTWVLAEAWGINSHGQIVGFARDADWREHAFLLTPVAGVPHYEPMADLLELAGTFSPAHAPVPLLEAVPEPASAVAVPAGLLLPGLCRRRARSR